MSVTHPPPITAPYPQFPHFNDLKQKQYFHKTTNLLQKKHNINETTNSDTDMTLPVPTGRHLIYIQHKEAKY